MPDYDNNLPSVMTWVEQALQEDAIIEQTRNELAMRYAARHEDNRTMKVLQRFIILDEVQELK